nr:MAG TPA: hypothetical protein [Bacteriophage sp.]
MGCHYWHPLVIFQSIRRVYATESNKFNINSRPICVILL